MFNFSGTAAHQRIVTPTHKDEIQAGVERELV